MAQDWRVLKWMFLQEKVYQLDTDLMRRKTNPRPFSYINQRFVDLQENNPEKLKDAAWLQEHVAFTGELMLGHLRYGTYGGNSIEQCHPFLRQSNWRTRSLVLQETST